MCIRDSFCTTESIANYLQKYIIYRKRKIFYPKTGKLVDLLPFILKHKTEKFLYAVSDVNNGNESKILTDNNIDFTRAVLYRTVSNDFGPDEAFDYDMLIFFSPSGIQALLKNFPDFEQKEIAIGTFGPATAQAAKDAGLRLDMEAPTSQYPSITAALDDFVKKHNC